jgi:hypothetical protein
MIKMKDELDCVTFSVACTSLRSFGASFRGASSPGAGEGNCRRFVVFDTSHSDLTVSAVPQHALTFLSVVFRGMGIRGLTLIGCGHFSEVQRT